MDMKVGHLLMAMAAIIGEQAIAGRREPSIARDLADGANEARYFSLGCLGGEIVPGDIAALGNDEDVDRGLRIDVLEGERVIVLMNLLAGQFPAQDAGEDVAVIIGRSGVYRHGQSSLRAAFS